MSEAELEMWEAIASQPAPRVELPGMVELSPEAHKAGLAEGLRDWRATYPFGVTASFRAVDMRDAIAQAGAECLLLEDLEAGELDV